MRMLCPKRTTMLNPMSLVYGWQTAQMLGLVGKVDKEFFKTLALNFDPTTGKQLTPSQWGERRSGDDFTVSTNKSYSILHALSKGEEK